MIGIHGIHRPGAAKYHGRAKGMNNKVYPAVLVSGGACPVSCAKGRAWRRWAVQVQEWGHLIRKGAAQDRPDVAALYCLVLEGPSSLRADPG